MYDARDLTTHAVIIGMTGSGKTGLGIDLIEEALIDRIPVIAIDPKGDLGNLALRFPRLTAEEFRPWIDAQQAATAGISPEEYATQQASTWQKGIASWGQSPDRIQRLIDSADVTIFTPGSSAGTPISLLRAFDAPPSVIFNDEELLQERVNATATGLLALLGINADPISSREHILIANLLNHAWRTGRSLDLATLIGHIQQPPFATVGVMPLDSVFPPKDRMALAMQLNNLLAAPGFQAWLLGDALDTADLLYDAGGKPRASVMSIAHLSDAERMFFVTLLLADILAWVRSQSGTGSLRAILYIDELFGFMPPVANPPSKKLLLTLLKQARAFGLGVVLSTQNPVDLDYRGLSNAGTWFIGRMQTERDKQRVMDGLVSAASGQTLDRSALEKTISGLGKRVFLLHSVHEPAPIIFETRWALSYLAGPMTREQIRTVTAGSATPTPAIARTTTHGSAATSATSAVGVIAAIQSSASATGARGPAPVLPPDIAQYWLAPVEPTDAQADVVYMPAVFGLADVSLTSAKLNVSEQRRVGMLASIDDGPIAVDWDRARKSLIDPAVLERTARSGANFAPLPPAAMIARNYAEWSRSLNKWLVNEEQITLFRSTALKTTSDVGETERDFRIRLQQLAREARDQKIETVRARYESKLSTLRERIRRGEHTVEKEKQQASRARMDTAVSVGGAILGAIFGRGKMSATTFSKVGTAVRGMGREREQSGDVTRATDSLQALMEQESSLTALLRTEIDALEVSYDAQAEQLETTVITPRASDVRVQFVALLWMPYVRDAAGMQQPAWR